MQVIDIGGSRVKFTVWGKRTKRNFPSGPELTPRRFIQQVLSMTADWRAFDKTDLGNNLSPCDFVCSNRLVTC